jgi:site-specific DNA recombinase
VALSARVSTDRQTEAQTVSSQLAALRERAASDGLAIAPAHEFVDEYVDEGYSGATLVRPALERLRDLAALGGVEALDVHSPDRLARKYLHQALLLDEVARIGVRVVFLNQAHQQTPEDEVLLRRPGGHCRGRAGQDYGAGAPRTASRRTPGLALGVGPSAVWLSLPWARARG